MYRGNKVLPLIQDCGIIVQSLRRVKLTQAIVPAYVSVYEIVNTAAKTIQRDLYQKP